MPQSTSLICATPMKLADAVGFGLLLLVNQEEILNDVAVGWSHSNDLFGLLHVKIKPNLSKPCTASHRIDSVKGNNETDLAALHAFKAGVTHDPHGALSSWNATTHFCQWEGVYCDRWRQRVRVLKLPSLNLTGTLSPFVGNLSFLWALELINNSFTGTIPPEMGRLFRLQALYLNNNSFVGEIPSNISSCSHLIALDISFNGLIGGIPRNLGLLVNLQTLQFRGNNLMGTIPPSMANLTSLILIDLSDNNLNGTIPDSLGRLHRLAYLALDGNQLSGIVPLSIFNLSSLIALDLGVNLLEGSLPSNLLNASPNLQWFSIADNRFTGSIPPSMSNFSSLEVLQLDNNNLHGLVPSLRKLKRLKLFRIHRNSLGTGQPTDLAFVSSLANASMLDSFEIAENNFGGTFPSIVCNFSMLTTLTLEMNKITGEIPTCIESLTYLQAFHASYNQLSGDIPPNIGKLQQLGVLVLDDNLLSGNIPPAIGNLTQLIGLVLSQNHLQGHIPPALGNLQNLIGLDLSHNSLAGVIPGQLFDHSPFNRFLYLSDNHLTGSLPLEIGKLQNLGALNVSGAMLSGEIPSTLGACVSLESLDMSQNFFSGPIPETFSALRGLTELDLSLNNLSGKIPGFLATFSLQMLNLSYNDLQGEVPIGGVFNNLTALSIVGNKGLCGGIPELKLPPCNHMKNQKRRLPFKIRLTVAILCGTSGLILVAALISLFIFRHKKKRQEANREPEGSLPNLSYQSLLKATNGFSPENLIGSGSFGVVYKGTLEQDGITVAIKVFNLEHRGASRSFMAECEVLKNVRHRNLVKVITACSGIDYQGNDFKALVYEYMENGSLENWLHEKPASSAEGTGDPPRNLNLLERLNIVVDVASALEYLHHGFGAPVVHCDLKPSNVLLDDEMVAHVGDFGLAKFLSQGISDSNGNQSSSVGVRGTIGYAPPEYGMGNEPSTYGDVYSFGILLLEIFTGRRPTDNIFGEGSSLYGFVKAALPDHVMEVVDHTLLKDIVGEDINTTEEAYYCRRRSGRSERMLDALRSILEIAISCATEVPHDRHDMVDVAAKLSSIRNKLIGAHLRPRRRIQPGN